MLIWLRFCKSATLSIGEDSTTLTLNSSTDVCRFGWMGWIQLIKADVEPLLLALIL